MKVRDFCLGFILILGIENIGYAALSAKEIMQKNEESRKIEDITANAKLIRITEGKVPKEKAFKFWRKQVEGGLFSSLTRFSEPAENKNEGILFLEQKEGKADVFLYLPVYKKIRRVESSQQSGAFMGSDLSYADMTAPHADDYEHKLLNQSLCNVADVSSGVACYQIESTPKNSDVRNRYGYSKSVTWVRTDQFTTVAMDHYNLEGVLIKKIQAKQVKLVDTQYKRYFAHELFVENQIKKSSTRLIFSEVKANQGVDSGVFTQNNLQNVK